MQHILSYTLYSNEKGLNIDVGDILIVLLAYLVTLLVFKVIYRIIDRRVESENKPKIKLVFNFVKYFVVCVVIITVLNSIGIKFTTLLIGTTGIFVGLGFGLQRLFQDIISGILILMDKSINVDDVIEVEGRKGKVFEIHLRTTRLRTIENKVLIIPNHKFLDDALYNWTQNELMVRESVSVGVAYGSDIELVKTCLCKAAKANHQVLKYPEPIVIFKDFGDSALVFKVSFSLSEGFESDFVKSDIRFRIDALFREHGVAIPFPQRDIHIISKPDNK